ncbi:hypothetical protein NECAME_04632, partial [Necator americanus]
GLFTCSSLLRRLPRCNIDVFDASPVPFGLVRYGVAPDHQEVKNCINAFDKMFETNRDRLALFCNVKVGSDLSMKELTRHYDAVLLAYGAHRPRQLDIPGAESKNVISGSDFVSWYNGVPNAKVSAVSSSFSLLFLFQQIQFFCFDDPNVVIIGNGNVALDCARMLSTAKSLRATDIPSKVIAVLEESQVKNIKIIGRRGPQNVSFTIKELREQFKVPGWNTTVEMDAEEVLDLKKEISTMHRRRKRLMNLLLDGVKPQEEGKQCRFLNHRIPEEVIPDTSGRVSAVRFLNKRTDSKEVIHCGLLIYSIGFQTVVLDGVPKNDKGMIAMKDSFRVDMPCGSFVYAAGWCAHGPRGVIVDTQQDSVVVAEQIAKDFSTRSDITGSLHGAAAILDARHVNYITWDEWKKIDDMEIKEGLKIGKIREKLTKFNGFLYRRS